MSGVLESFLRHEKALKKYLTRFFSRRQDIDDIAQEAFIKAFATELRADIRHPKGLLFRAAKHAALSELAKKAHTTTDYLEDIGESPVLIDKESASSDEIVDGRLKLAVFSKAVAKLPPTCRKVFILRKFEGLTTKEIAARMKISVSAVEKHIGTGLMKTSRFMEEVGYEPSEFGRASTKPARAKMLKAGGNEVCVKGCEND